MQYQQQDSIVTTDSPAIDSIKAPQPIFIESRALATSESHYSLYSSKFARETVPDWFFIAIILVVSGIAWARIIYGKFINTIWISAYSYQTATKVFNEQSVVQKRFSLSLDLLYLINSSLFLYLVDRYFNTGFSDSNDLSFIVQALIVLSMIILFRIFVMRFVGFIFNQTELFRGFLFHYFIFNKVLGMVLIPFLIAIPYTKGIVQEILMYTGISLVLAVFLLRLIREVIYVLKNVILIFYLILYLCILEILPLLVVFKLLLSLARV